MWEKIHLTAGVLAFIALLIPAIYSIKITLMRARSDQNARKYKSGGGSG